MTFSSMASLQTLHQEGIRVEDIQYNGSRSDLYVKATGSQRRRGDGGKHSPVDSEESCHNLTVENETLRAQLDVLSSQLARSDTERVRWRAQFLRIQKERDSFRRELDRSGPTNGHSDMPPFSSVNDYGQEQRLALDLSSFSELVEKKSTSMGNGSQRCPSPPLSTVLPSISTGIPIHRGRLRGQKTNAPKLPFPKAIGVVTTGPASPGVLDSAYYDPIDHNNPPLIQPVPSSCCKHIHDMELFPSTEPANLSRSGSTCSMTSQCPSLLSESDSRSRNSSLSSVSSISHSSLQTHSSQFQCNSPWSTDDSQDDVNTTFRSVTFRDDMQLFIDTEYTGMDNGISVHGSGLESCIDVRNGCGGDVDLKEDVRPYAPMMSVIPRFKRTLRGPVADTTSKQFSESNVSNNASQARFTDPTTLPTFNTNDVTAPFDSVNNPQLVSSHLSTSISGAAARRQSCEASCMGSGSSGVTVRLTPNGTTSFVTTGKEELVSNRALGENNFTILSRPHSHASPYPPDPRPSSPAAIPFSSTKSSTTSGQSFPRITDSSGMTSTPSAPSTGLPFPSPRFKHSHLVHDDPDYGPVIVHGLLPSRHTVYRSCDGNHLVPTRGRKEAFSVPPRYMNRGSTGR